MHFRESILPILAIIIARLSDALPTPQSSTAPKPDSCTITYDAVGNWSTYDLCISTLDPDYLAESTRDNGQLVRSFMAYPNCAELADPKDWRYFYDERSNVMQAHFRSNVTGVPTNVEMGMIRMGAARGFECVVV